MGIKFLTGKEKDADYGDLKKDDIVIIPAFGTEATTRKMLEEKGCRFVDTTCGDVMSVWKRVRQYSKDKVTSIIHGKAWHEETKATSSQATPSTGGHYLVVFTLAETDYVCNYILNGGNKEEFLRKFKGAYSEGFDPDKHLTAIGVANQTTMLRNETEDVQRRLRRAMAQRFGESEIDRHFRFFDTICGATQDRQDALSKLLQEPLNLLLVIGGYNSSNTSHLAEMGEAKLPTFFIKNAAMMKSDSVIWHYDQHKHQEIETSNWLPEGKITVGITAGASCPNNLIEDTIHRLFELRGISVQEVIGGN
jgi:4-hydroxy-3-methylbut-2-enyl diphosphate reductase